MPKQKRRSTTQCGSVTAVITELGGIAAVAKLTGRGTTAVHNWVAVGRFSARVFLVMTKALAREGATAPAALWGQEEGNVDVAA